MFTCRVRFTGDSVIDGIRRLVPLRMADAPLPDHLSQLHSMTANHFILTEAAQEL